jgi:hypothetical protein
MSRRCVPSGDMRRLLALMDARDGLDEATAERVLQGRVPMDDAPPRYGNVVRAIELLGGEATEFERGDSAKAVAVITARIRRDAVSGGVTPGRNSMSTRRLAKVAAASTIGAVSLFGGLAAANALPGAAQGVAAEMLSKVGVTVPDPDSHAGSHPDTRGQSESHPTDAPSSDVAVSPETPPAAPPASSAGQGNTTSELARTTTETGVDKGAVISTAASDGQSQAGQHGPPEPVTTGSAPSNTPPVETPNTGGTSTANTASDGHSTVGTTTADTNSDGHSAAGSANATAGLSHKP